jgi:subtilase-type serine protease
MFVTGQDIPEEFRIQGAYGSSQFVADLPGIGAIIDAGKPTERVCNDVHCGLDVWRNDISGHGGLTKQGIGTLVLTGANTYAGPTLVNQGRLAINGSLASTVTVNDSGILGGNGRIGGLTAKRGGTVAPGNSIGTLQVAGDVTFEPGSTYAVELSPTSSDQIVTGGKAVIDGATVSLSLENSPTLLTAGEVKSLLGNQYNILQAAGGIDGRFGAVVPNYLFIGGSLDYSASGIHLAVERNAASFASVGQTPNQRAVAAAVEQLGAGNALYETLLLSPSAAVAQQAFQQLSGEIYPAIGTLLINDSRYLRDAVGERLREHDLFDAAAPTDNRSNAWLKVLGAWGKSDGGHDNASSNSSIGGLLAGVDGLITEDTRLGFVTGYSDSSLSMGDGTHSSASVDSYHLGAYLGHEIDALRLSVGGAYSWHRIDVKRNLQLGDVSGKQKSKNDATTAQLFTEAAYRLDVQPLALEPSANLAYVHLNSDSFTEKGDAAALKGGEDNRDAVLSTLGLRASKAIVLSDKQQLELSGTLGWQRNLSSTQSEDHLAFASGNTAFSVQSVSLDRNAAVIGARAGLAVAQDVRVSLDYNGLVGSNEKDHGVGLTLDWQF